MTLRDIDLRHLTDEERHKVLEVLQRDEQLREAELKRVRNLKDEVKTLRLKGTIREGRSATRTCARCREPFGIIFNTGSICAKCQHRVCKKCQESVSPGKWICVFCFRQMEFEAKSGNWFYSKFPRSMRDRATNEIVSGGKIVRDAISIGSLVDGLETWSPARLSPQPPFLFREGKNSGELEAYACVGLEHIPEAYHSSTEFALPRVPGGESQFGASERRGDATTMGACGHAMYRNCSAERDLDSFQDSIVPGLPLALARSENSMAAELTETDVGWKFSGLEPVTNVGNGEVEMPREVLDADQSETGASKQLEESHWPVHEVSNGNWSPTQQLTCLADLNGSDLTKAEDISEDVELWTMLAIGKKGKECGPLVLHDPNDSVFEDDDVCDKCEETVKCSDDRVPYCAERVDGSGSEGMDAMVPLRSICKDSSGMLPVSDGSNATSMPLTVVGDFEDLSLHHASVSSSSPTPRLSDSEDVTNSAALTEDCERSRDSQSKSASVSELTLSLDKAASAAHPVNECTAVDDLSSDHLTNNLVSCLNEGITVRQHMNADIAESCASREDAMSNRMSCNGTSSSAEDVMSNEISSHGTSSSGEDVMNNEISSHGTSSSGEDAMNNQMSCNGTSSSAEDVMSNEVPPHGTLSSGEDVMSNEVPSHGTSSSDPVCKDAIDDRLVGGSSMLDPIVRSSNTSCSNGSVGGQDSVRSKVGALLAKYGRSVTDYDKSSDRGSALTEERNSLCLNGSEPISDNSQVSYQPSSPSHPSSATLKDANWHQSSSEGHDDLRNKHDLTALVDSSVLANNINNSNNFNLAFDENIFDVVKERHDFLGSFDDRRTNSVFQQTTAGHIASPSKHSWDQVEENGTDSYGGSDGFSHSNFFLDDLEWDAGELDGSDDFGVVESYEDDMASGLYSFGTSESGSTDLTSLRDMLSTCLSQSSSDSAGSPPHSPSEFDNAVNSSQPSIVIGRGFPLSRQKFRRTLANRRLGVREVTIASNEDDDDDNESLLSAISEHTEPDYLSDD